MREFIIDMNKDWENVERPAFQRITVLDTVKHIFTGVVHYKIRIEDQSGYIDERWILEDEFNNLKEKATYDMRAKMY